MSTLELQVKQFKALSDETRLKILKLLIDNELCGCDLIDAFSFTQPTMSYHMKILMDAHLVNGRKDGSWMWYTINQENVEALVRFLETVSNKNK